MGRFGRVGGNEKPDRGFWGGGGANEKPAERPLCPDRPPPFLGGRAGQRIGGGRSGRFSLSRVRAPAREMGSNKLK